MAIPTLHMHTAQSGNQSLPRSAPTVETLDRLQAAFPGQASPAVIAVKADTNTPALRQAINVLRAAATSSGQRYGAISIDTNPAHTVARITIPLPGSGVDVLSVAAAYGVVVAVFQYGWGEQPAQLPVKRRDRPWLPLFALGSGCERRPTSAETAPITLMSKLRRSLCDVGCVRPAPAVLLWGVQRRCRGTGRPKSC